MVRSTILVTGALGYIGSHTIVELLQTVSETVEILALDNLSNSSIDVLERIKLIIGDYNRLDRFRFVQADVTDFENLCALFSSRYFAGKPIEAVIHFAALKAVSESIEQPLKYYRENVGGLTNVLEAMQAWDCKKIIFSSSATVYGSLSEKAMRCVETMARHTKDALDTVEGIQGCVGLTNPYGRTKWMCEAILHDFCVANTDVHATALRYFNPVGAHPSGHLTETPRGPPSNLMPNITAAMEAKRPVQIYGTDYDTADGTAVRDYIHVVDLAKGHVAALKHVQSLGRGIKTIAPRRHQESFASILSDDSDDSEEGSSQSSISTSIPTPPTPLTPESQDEVTSFFCKQRSNGLQVFNLGTGRGHTVKEVIVAMEKASGEVISFTESERRKGDVAFCVADPTKANREWAWFATKTLEDACRDVCRSKRLRRAEIESSEIHM